MDIIKLIHRVPGAIYNREQRKVAEKEQKKILDELFPVIEAYLQSKQTNEDFMIYQESFERKAIRINKSLTILQVDVDYFVKYLAVPAETEYDTEKPVHNWAGYAIIAFIIFILTALTNYYIWGV